MKYFTFFMVIAALTGCVSAEADLEKAGGICKAGGYQEGTQPYQACMSREVSTLEENRRRVGAALGAGLQSYGNSTRQSGYASPYSQPTYRAPVRCTSNQIGNSVYTNCY